MASQQARAALSNAQWLRSRLEQRFRAHSGFVAGSSSDFERPVAAQVQLKPAKLKSRKAGKQRARAVDSNENISIDVLCIFMHGYAHFTNIYA